jgi:hypothetical protein
MKILQSILIFLTCTINSHGQTDTNSYAQITVGRIAIEITKQKKPNKISTKVEITSAFPSGDSAWVMSFQNKLNQTIPFRNGAKEGKYTVSVKFIVDKNGRLG